MSFKLFNTSFLEKDVIYNTKNIIKSEDKIIQSIDFNIKKERMRCSECKCKVNITNSLECKCGQVLCMKHRMFNQHNCSIDYKTNDRKILEKNNPKIVSDKIIVI